MSMLQLVVRYVITLDQYGLDSDEIKKLKEAHAKDSEFFDYVNAFDSVYRHLNGSVMVKATALVILLDNYKEVLFDRQQLDEERRDRIRASNKELSEIKTLIYKEMKERHLNSFVINNVLLYVNDKELLIITLDNVQR